MSYFFNDSSAWGNAGIPAPLSDFSFPENITIKINKNMLSSLGYNDVTVPSTTKIVFLEDDIHFITKSITMDGIIELNVNSFITVDTFSQANLIAKLWHVAASWDNGVVPGEGDDVNIPENIAIIISTETNLQKFYGNITIPNTSQIIFDTSVSDKKLIAISFSISGSIVSTGQNTLQKLRGYANLYLPVYLDSNGLVQNLPANAVSTMDASSNFIMHCNQTKASTFSKFIKYNVDIFDNHKFKYNSTEKTNFETELITDIENETLYHYDRKFLDNIEFTTDNTLSNFLIQYISAILFDRPDVNNVITNQTNLTSSIINSNIQQQISSAVKNSLNTSTFQTGNAAILSMFNQIKSQIPDRIEDTINVEYNFPIKSGDTIALFIKMNANLAFNQTSADNGHTEELYNVLKNNIDWKPSYYNLLEFDDVNRTVNIVPSTWRIIINLA
ncbi:MAG: hypothetical protein CXT73_04995 [Methanobacteriota archaeon]|nr:MAG: hypothetical protein CXT73_04995 [Euryarchaeota archaeon]